MQQESSASCVVEDGSDPPDPYPYLPPLRRPSFSLELFNRFSQDALNASLPDNPPVNYTDMDYETDANADTTTGILPTCSDSLASLAIPSHLKGEL